MTHFTIGDRVQWPHTTRRGRTISIDTRYGKIVSIKDDTATVLPTGKRTGVRVALSQLRPAGDKSAVNEFLQAVFKRNRGE